MSALRLVAPTQKITPGADGALGSYLDRLAAQLKLGAAARAEVVVEIEDHLRDRVRDLMVNGLTEHEAAIKAVAELGEPAVLAARFTAAIKRPQRRRIMNIGLLGLGGAAIVTALVTMSNPGKQAGVSVFSPEAHQSAAGSAAVVSPRGSKWEDFFVAAGKSANMPVFIHWSQLTAVYDNLHADGGMDIEIGDGFSLDRALALINDSLNRTEDDGIAYRVEDGKLVFASAEYFDLRDVVLTSFDLSDLAVGSDGKPLQSDAVDDRMERVTTLVQSIVHSNLWVGNGGNRASIYTFGSKLFMKAPKRMLPQIEWLLSEIRNGSLTRAEFGANRVPILRDVPVVALNYRVDPAAPARTDLKQFPLGHIDSSATTAFLQAATEISPALHQVKLSSSPNTNTVFAGGTLSQIEIVERLLALIDRPAPGEAVGGSASKTFNVSHADPDAVRDLIGKAFNLSPAVKQCAVLRMLDSKGDEVSITATQDQLDWAGDFIKTIDRPFKTQ